MQLKDSKLNAAIGMLDQSDIDHHVKQNWTGCHSASFPVQDTSSTTTLFFHQWTLQFFGPISGFGVQKESLELTMV